MTQPLEDDAVKALKAGKLIQAIKIVRQERNIGLKEAKEVVDAYVKAHPEIEPPPREGSFLRVVIMAAVVLLIFGVYRMLTGE